MLKNISKKMQENNFFIKCIYIFAYKYQSFKYIFNIKSMKKIN